MLLLGVVIVNKKIKLHLHQYILHYIVAIILLILINFLVIKFYNDYQENKKIQYDFSNYDYTMLQIYNINPSLFKFNSDNIAIVEMSDLLKPITNGKDTMYFGEVPMTKEQDQCVGYIIVKKINEELKFDYSHLCDMIDY